MAQPVKEWFLLSHHDFCLDMIHAPNFLAPVTHPLAVRTCEVAAEPALSVNLVVHYKRLAYPAPYRDAHGPTAICFAKHFGQ